MTRGFSGGPPGGRGGGRGFGGGRGGGFGGRGRGGGDRGGKSKLYLNKDFCRILTRTTTNSCCRWRGNHYM